MCGRYAASKDQADLILELDVELDATDEPTRSVLAAPQQPPPGTPDFNLAPTKQAPVVLTRAPRTDRDADPVRQLRLLTWGLVPGWAKDPKVGLRMINARAESVLGTGAFAKAALTRRCLVPADGWYEWQVSPTALDAKGKPCKQPFFIHRGDGAVCAFAGLYEFWRDPQVADPEDPLGWLSSFTIVTTAAEPGLDRIHDRQPLVLERADWARWLDPAMTDPDEVAALLAFAQPGRFAAYPVTTAVNGSRNNGPQLLDPAPAASLHGVVDPTTGEIVGD
ncbi:MAG TPA: SOS response-associated peptidase [Dermatophilaceae bacterium]|nr:SOS response-associated peptidase [Dermatophilaceae bacterium]